MPWCEQCERRFTDEELASDDCPVCATPLVEKRTAGWMFKFMIVASVIYLGYRTYQGVTWLLHHG